MASQIANNPRSIRWWIAAGFIVFVMLFGGGSRPDVLSIVWLRPVAVLVGAYALYTVRMEDLRGRRFLVAMAAAILLLTASHLVPLPPSLWHALPGRGIVVDIDRAARLGDVWRPISLVPTATWNALYSLSVPAAVFFLLLPMDGSELAQMLRVFIAVITLSAMVGLLQATGSSLILYDISNPNAGLFANRNHQAVVLACIFPMLAVFAQEAGHRSKERKVRLVGAVALGLAIVPLLLVTGSRAGLVAAVAAIASIPLIVPMKWKRAFSPKVITIVGGALAVVVLIAWVASLTDRNFVLSRFTELNAAEDMRYPVWQITVGLVGKYFPFGSGIGSFEQVFQIDEPTALLMPIYWNHAHNDWLELALVGGLPAMVLLILAVGGYGVAAYRAFMSSKFRGPTNVLAKLGCVIIAVLGLASVVDYPLRTPAAAALFVFATMIAAKPRKSASSS